MARIFVITGTPGTGKTTLATALLRRLPGAKLIESNALIKKKRLFSSYSSDGSMVARMKPLESELRRLAAKEKGTLIIEGHLLCDIRVRGATAIVLREHLGVIRKRLISRGYAPEKIRDNLVCEALDYCGFHASENYGRVFELMSGKAAAGAALKIIGGKGAKAKRIELLGEMTSIMEKDKSLAI